MNRNKRAYWNKEYIGIMAQSSIAGRGRLVAHGRRPGCAATQRSSQSQLAARRTMPDVRRANLPTHRARLLQLPEPFRRLEAGIRLSGGNFGQTQSASGRYGRQLTYPLVGQRCRQLYCAFQDTGFLCDLAMLQYGFRARFSCLRSTTGAAAACLSRQL